MDDVLEDAILLKPEPLPLIPDTPFIELECDDLPAKRPGPRVDVKTLKRESRARGRAATTGVKNHHQHRAARRR